MCKIVPLKRVASLKVIMMSVGWSVVAIPMVFGGSALSDEELDTVGAGGAQVEVAAEGGATVPKSDTEVKGNRATGEDSSLVWPFQRVPSGTSQQAPLGFSQILKNQPSSSSLFPQLSTDPNVGGAIRGLVPRSLPPS